MQEFAYAEPVAANRRFYVCCFDLGDMKTPEIGEAGGQPEISIQGGTPANTVNTLVAVDAAQGIYYVELDVTEISTVGTFCITYTSANIVQYQMLGRVVQDTGNVSNDDIKNLVKQIAQRVNWIEWFLKDSDTKARQLTNLDML